MMTASELLKPRFQVIADYPKSYFKAGDILERIERATNDYYSNHQFNISESMLLEDLEKYPHLFRKLDWWELRKIEDMPKRLKSEDSEDYYDILEWDMDFMRCIAKIGSTGIKIGCSLTTHPKGMGYIPVD